MPVEVRPSSALLPDGLVLDGYRSYLVLERGLAGSTIAEYERVARLFFGQRPVGSALGELAAADVSGFLARECPRRSVSGARHLVSPLRSVLRYLHIAGLITVPLVSAVPGVVPHERDAPPSRTRRHRDDCSVARATKASRPPTSTSTPTTPAIVGIDSLNIDDITDPQRPVHTLLLGAGIPIVEHLCNLDALPANGFRFHAVPVKVEGMGTFPVRAYAELAASSER